MTEGDDIARTRAEIEARFGFFPPFFEPALASPAVLRSLFASTCSSYLDNPLPHLWKEQVFARLSRYCSVPYCILSHSCALRPLGMSAGDVLDLLEAPAKPPSFGATLALLESAAPLDRDWPPPGSPLHGALLDATEEIYLGSARAEALRTAVRDVLGPFLHVHWLELLQHVKLSHLWVEAHPELSYEADAMARDRLQGLLSEDPRLAEFFASYPERVAAERADWLRRLEDENARSAERWSTLVAHTPHVVMELDAEGLIRSINRVPRGQTKADVIGTCAYDHVSPEHRATIRTTVEGVIASGEPRALELETLGPDGASAWYSATHSPIFQGSTVRGVMVIAEDITERKLEELELRKAHEIARSAEEAGELGSWRWELRSGEVVWSDNLCRLHGLEPGGFDGRLETALRFIHPDDVERISELSRAMLADRAPTPMEYRIVAAAGATRTVVASNRLLLDPAGEVTHVVGVVQDVTDRRSVERQLDRATRLEALGTLAGGIAHGFNNLLQGIAGNVELALEDVPPGSEAHECLSDALTAADRAATLVRQILRFGRRGERSREPVRLQGVLTETLELLRASLPPGIEIRASGAAECGPVSGDASELLQVIVNLCGNARDAMRESGGVLTISIAEVRVDAALAKAHPELAEAERAETTFARLTVSDTGCGMDAETLSHAFDPFFTTKGVGQGSGMGLASVFGTVRDLGGVVTLESALGEGTTVQVYLPLFAEEPPAPAEDSDRAPPSAGGRVLIVDDEAAVARMLDRSLRRLGYEPEVFTDPAEALDRFVREPERFDLLLTDHLMPGLTGLELAVRVLAVRPDLPVVLCSGYVSADLGEVVEAAGVRVQLRKPVGLRALGAALRRALASDDKTYRA